MTNKIFDPGQDGWKTSPPLETTEESKERNSQAMQLANKLMELLPDIIIIGRLDAESTTGQKGSAIIAVGKGNVCRLGNALGKMCDTEPATLELVNSLNHLTRDARMSMNLDNKINKALANINGFGHPFQKKAPDFHYFKRHQRDEIYHYYEVVGGPGRTPDGYQTVVNFLNPYPIVSIERNDMQSPTGTWCQFEIGIPIDKSEYKEALKKALDHPKCDFK